MSVSCQLNVNGRNGYHSHGEALRVGMEHRGATRWKGPGSLIDCGTDTPYQLTLYPDKSEE